MAVFFISAMTPNDRGYGHWRSPLHGMFHLREHSLSWNDKVNAGLPAAGRSKDR
jgi:hypothetical protein